MPDMIALMFYGRLLHFLLIGQPTTMVLFLIIAFEYSNTVIYQMRPTEKNIKHLAIKMLLDNMKLKWQFCYTNVYFTAYLLDNLV